MAMEDSYWYMYTVVERANLKIFVKKYEELLKAHNLDIDLSVDTSTTELLTNFRILAKTANRDHIAIFKALGIATGLFTVEQIQSANPTQWWYEVTPTVY